MKLLIIILAALMAFTACGQTPEDRNDQTKSSYQNNKKKGKMDLSKLTNEQVKEAIEAQLNNDKKAWFRLFAQEVKFTDDGNTIDFKTFFENAFNHKEKFLDISRVENNGKDVYGRFDAGQWGVFNVFFKFQMNADGKFDRLDIGADK